MGNKVVPIVEAPILFEDKNATALESALKVLNISIRWNTRRVCAEYSEDGIHWTMFDDRSMSRLSEDIAAKFSYRTESRGPKPLHFGRERWHTCLNALLAEQEVDPFREWLYSLPHWDMKPRIDRLLIKLFDAPDDPFTRWTARYILIGAIWRTKHPGYKLDEFPVLVGPQGIGKSSFCRALFPEIEDAADWFNDGVRLSASDKEKSEALRGAVLAEFSELSGIGRAELEHLKAFLTRQNDGVVRMAYARNKERMLRTCVFVGTTNRSDCLPNDPTGNRRFVPIQCQRGSNIEKYMAERREQLWAEAYAYFAADCPANLPRKLLEQQKERAKTHRKRDALAEDFVASLPTSYPLRLSEIVRREDIPHELKSSNGSHRIAQAFEVLGWINKQMTLNGLRARYWVPPGYKAN